MITGLHDGIENVAEIDMMPAPAAVANVDARPWYIVGRDVPHRDARIDGPDLFERQPG